MNTKNNKRRRASQEKIQQAFLELLQSRELPQITVSDICKQTGLNRSTFYANYEDIYRLADTIRDRLEEELNELYENDVVNNCGGDYLKLFYHIRDNQLFYITYFKLGYDTSHTLDLERLNQIHGKRFPLSHTEYHIAFHKAGLNAVIKKWLSTGCQEPPEEMVAIIESEYKRRSE